MSGSILGIWYGPVNKTGNIPVLSNLGAQSKLGSPAMGSNSRLCIGFPALRRFLTPTEEYLRPVSCSFHYLIKKSQKIKYGEHIHQPPLNCHLCFTTTRQVSRCGRDETSLSVRWVSWAVLEKPPRPQS